MEPAQIPIAGILPAVDYRESNRAHVDVPGRSLCNYSKLCIRNGSKFHGGKTKATIFGMADVWEPEVSNINAESEVDTSRPEKPRKQERNEMLYRKLLRRKLDHLTGTGGPIYKNTSHGEM